MWLSFLACAGVLALALFVPGYLVLRSFGLCRAMSLCFAPVLCVVLFCVAGVVFHEIGIDSSAMVYSFLLWLPCLFALAAGVLRGNRLFFVRLRRHADSLVSLGAGVFLIYLAFGVLSSIFVFLLPLEGPNSAVQTYDNVHQFGLIRSFADSGSWCSLHTSLYLDVASAAIDPIPGEGYYPAAFHALAAFLMSAVGSEVTVASNAVLFVFSALVFPVEMFCFMRVLFGGDMRRVAFGAPLAVALPSFPWLLLDYWPLYPNVISMVLLPAVIVPFLVFWEKGTERTRRFVLAVLLALSLVCEVFVQPNAIFSAALFLVPFLIHLVADKVPSKIPLRLRFAIVFAVGAACALLCLAVWALLVHVPFLQSVVDFYWPPIYSFEDAVLSVLGATFLAGEIMFVPATLVLFGVTSGVLRSETRWIVFSFVLASAVYVVAASFDDVWLKHFVSGFWYTDPYRVGALASLCAVPVAAQGAYGVCSMASQLVGRVFRAERVPSFFYVAVFVLCCLYPFASYASGGPLLALSENARALNGRSEYMSYDGAKQQFVEESLARLTDDDVLLNHPYDGSLFAYGIDGANLYYRHMSGYNGAEESRELGTSEWIRLYADDLFESGEAAKVLSDSGIRYVLKLGAAPEWSSAVFPDYEVADWRGIESIDDSTPGLSIVLSRGEMRLYEVEGQ